MAKQMKQSESSRAFKRQVFKRAGFDLTDRYQSELKKAVLHLSNALDAISSEHPDWKELDNCLDVMDSISVDFE